MKINLFILFISLIVSVACSRASLNANNNTESDCRNFSKKRSFIVTREGARWDYGNSWELPTEFKFELCISVASINQDTNIVDRLDSIFNSKVLYGPGPVTLADRLNKNPETVYLNERTVLRDLYSWALGEENDERKDILLQASCALDLNEACIELDAMHLNRNTTFGRKAPYYFEIVIDFVEPLPVSIVNMIFSDE